MPRELVAIAPNTPVLREYQDGPLPAGHVRVAVTFGAPKHGTELTLYHGARPASFPLGLGNICVGRISEIGAGVEGLAVGERVAGYSNLRETCTWRAAQVWRLSERMTPAEAVCFDPAQFALAGIRDGHLRLGDNAAVFGLGAIGQMAVQMARQAGARRVAGIDPLTRRRELAAQVGADLVLDPTGDDVEGALVAASDGRGLDVVIETSASYSALDLALKALAYGGTVAYVGWAKPCIGGLDLGGAAHFNVPNIVFARACSEPNRDHPRWDFRRIMATCWESLAAGAYACEGIVQPVAPFSDVIEAYREIDAHPERSIKLGVQF